MDSEGGAGERELLERLGALPREAEPSRDLWPEIGARLEGGGRTDAPPRRRGGTRWRRAAAAVALFAAGATTGVLGTRAGPSDESERDRGSMDRALALAAEVQRTGSEYVAALAAFASVVDSLSSDVRLQGTTAGLAALESAADQLHALRLAAVAAPEGSVIEPGDATHGPTLRF